MRKKKRQWEKKCTLAEQSCFVFSSCCWSKELLNKKSHKQKRACLTHLERKVSKLYSPFCKVGSLQTEYFTKRSSVPLQQKSYFCKKDFSWRLSKYLWLANVSEFFCDRISWESIYNYNRHPDFWKGLMLCDSENIFTALCMWSAFFHWGSLQPYLNSHRTLH